MAELTEEELFDFIRCPIRYDAIRNKRIITGQEDSMPRYLEKVAHWFFLQLMNGVVPATSKLKQKWDKLCEQHSDYITPQKNLEGVDKLMKLFRWAEDEQLVVGDTDIPYEYAIKDERGVVSFRGEIGTVAQALKRSPKPFLLYLDFGNKYPDQAMLDMKLKYTLDSYAIAELSNKCLGIKIHHVKSGNDFYTMRQAQDYERMKKVVANVARSIQQKLYYPRENVMCANCDMENFCRIWKG